MNRFSPFSILFSFKPRTIYVANHHSQEIRHNSSSGGAFYAIASYVLSQNGIVIGAAYRGTDVEHIAISDKSELWKLQKSKYAPSSLKNINMDNLLDLGKLVMFSGTPCQVKGIAKKYRHHKNLLLLEIACHGVPNKKDYDNYIRENDIVKIDFRCKKNGWKNNLIELTHSDGSIVYEKAIENSFYQDFISGKNIRKGCFTCQSKYFSSGADFTVADAWGVNDFAPKLDDDIGSSIIVAHTKQSKRIWSKIKQNFLCQKVSLREAIRYNANILRPESSQRLFIERIDPYLCFLMSILKKFKSFITKLF